MIDQQQFEKLQESVNRIETAICGDEKMKIPGLASDVAEIKEWRRKLMLRLAFVSGGFVSLWEGIKLAASYFSPHDK